MSSYKSNYTYGRNELRSGGSVTTNSRNGGGGRCSTCRCLFVTLFLGGVGTAAALYFGLITREDLTNLADKIRGGFEDILNSDPFTGFGGSGSTDPNELSDIRWPTNGSGGLQLEIVNALDDRWTPFFDQAVVDWENGDPDALSLTTSRSSPDSSCKAIDKKMKVCNGNYGATGWRGINELMYDGANRILQSVAKMNEYYLDNQASNDERTYTMCHEIGHGFGLMHTDENFLNSPLGDCMDYSSNLKPNLLPGLINFQRLANMYGTVDGGGTGRNRHARYLRTKKTTDTASAPEWIKNAFEEKKLSLVFNRNKNVKTTATTASNDWTLIYQHEYGEIHKVDLGDGYYAHVRVLLASDQ